MKNGVVLVVGIIGSGKSRLCTELGAELDAQVLLEQAQEHGNPFIADFYLNMPRWSFALQIHQLAVRYRQHALAQWWALAGRGIAVVDGGFWMDTCFARMIRAAGLMEEREYETYRQTFQAMTANVLLPQIVIRISVSADIAIERLHRRAAEHVERASEATTVTEEYLSNLDREVTALCQELTAVGVEVINTFWDEDRSTAEQRRQAVRGLARRILEHDPPDPFLGHWRRRLG